MQWRSLYFWSRNFPLRHKDKKNAILSASAHNILLYMAPYKAGDKRWSQWTNSIYSHADCIAICKIRYNNIWLTDAPRLAAKYSSINMPGCKNVIFLSNVQIYTYMNCKDYYSIHFQSLCTSHSYFWFPKIIFACSDDAIQVPRNIFIYPV